MVTQTLHAQYVIQHQQPTHATVGEAISLEFIASGVSQNDVQEAILFYRFDNEVGYQQKEVFFKNGIFAAELTVDNASISSIEYYFQLSVINQEPKYFPETQPSQNPIRLNVIESGDQRTPPKRNKLIDYTILSPTPKEVLANDKVLIAIALFYDIEKLEAGEFHLYIDDVDITHLADTSAYYISYFSREYRDGSHTIRLDYITEKETYLVNEWDFSVVNPTAVPQFAGLITQPKPTGNIELGARNQVIGGDINNAYTGRTNVSGSYGKLRYSLNGFLTSQESTRLQPQNRYGINLDYGKWLRFQAGHIYPNMSKFSISGRRIYGVNTEVHLLGDNINAQFIYGEINRKVTNLYTNIEREELILNDQVVDTTYTLKYQNGGRGAFTREIVGGRVAFGNERKFQVGFHAMKVQDDTTSVFNVRTYTDILTTSPNLNHGLSTDDLNKLQGTPKLLGIENGSLQAKGNFIAGTDMKMAFAQNKIRLETEGIISALNNNIYGGALSVETADDLGFDIDSKTENFLDQVSRFIIINENMNVLPIKVKNINTDSTEAALFFPTSILASNSELSINYPKNNFRAQYRWIGPDFNSLANSTIRKDIAGITLSDRFRLMQNRIFVTLGYEFLKDNVTGAKEATTESITYRTNLSWYPISSSLPRVNVGVRYRTRDNGITRFNPYLPNYLQNQAIQNYSVSGMDTLFATAPKNNTTINITGSISQQFDLLDAVHDASLSYSSLKTTDEVFAFGDVNSSAISLNLTSRFIQQFRTQVGLTVNNSQSGSGQTDIKIFGMYASGSYFLLENKLNVNARLALTKNNTKVKTLIVDPTSQEDPNRAKHYYILTGAPIENQYSTYVIQAGAQYNLNDYHSFLVDANLTNVSGVGNTNDRIIQLRYIFKF